MQIPCLVKLSLAMAFLSLASATVASTGGHHHKGHHKGHHHKGHHHHHGHHHGKQVNASNTSSQGAEHASQKQVKSSVAPKLPSSAVKPVATAQTARATTASRDEQLVAKMKALELRLAKKKAQASAMEKGHILVSGPLPADFKERFSQAVAHATGIDAGKVTVESTSPVAGQPDVVAVIFKAPHKIVGAVEDQSADPDSKLATGNLHSFLVAKSEEEEDAGEPEEPKESKKPKHSTKATPVEEKGIDIDTAMPYGDLEPFGREDTAQELTEDSVTQSDEMVDQLERAEVAEEKRAVFRALTRLRGAAITSFDGVARSQTGNIDEYNQIHKWRNTHPLHHLADEESDVSKWAFPDNADF